MRPLKKKKYFNTLPIIEKLYWCIVDLVNTSEVKHEPNSYIVIR